jgi:hypothetical protein
MVGTALARCLPVVGTPNTVSKVISTVWRVVICTSFDVFTTEELAATSAGLAIRLAA